MYVHGYVNAMGEGEERIYAEFFVPDINVFVQMEAYDIQI